TLVFSDSKDAHKPWPGRPREVFAPEGGYKDDLGTVVSMQVSQTMKSGKYTLRDHHFERLTDPLEVSRPSTISIGNNGPLELYDYPGEYARIFKKTGRNGEVKPEGDEFTKMRMQQEETTQTLIRGLSSCGRFNAGFRFELGDYPAAGGVGGPYVLTSVQHSILQ